MKNLTSLILFASTLVASCSSPSYVHHAGPSLAVGAHRMAITAEMSGTETSASDNSGGAATPIDSDSISLDLTLGQVVAPNFELGGMFTYEDSSSDDRALGTSSSSNMYGLGAYGRFYIPTMMPGGLVPWIQASILFSGTMDQETTNASGGTSSEAELFGTALAVGVTSYLSESAAIEFAIATSTREADSWTGTDNSGGVVTNLDFDGLVVEDSSIDFTVGMSINF